jgi:hypothetical protein
LTALIMRLLSDDPDQRPTAEQARDTLAAVAEGRTSPDAGSTGTALLEGGAAAVAGQSARTAVAYRDTRAGSDRSDAPEMVATAAAMPPVTTAPRPAAGTGDGDRPAGGARRSVLFALLAVGVVALVILAVVLTRGGGETPSAPVTSSSAVATPEPARPPAPAPAPTTEAAPTTTATAPTTTTSTSTTSTTTTTTTSGDAPTATEAVAFVQSYYGLLPGNTSAAWDRLGPAAQARSGGRGSFDRFYAGLRSVTLENARPAGGNTVAGTILFVRNDGTTTRESYRFVVGNSGGRQVIESFSS